MFQAELAFADLNSPVDVIGGGIFFGASSWVSPIRHRMLGTIVLESRTRVAILSFERFADDPEGLQVETGLSEAALSSRLDALERHLLDFAVLSFDRRRREVRYRASPVISVPAYLAPAADGARIDWDYARLLAGREAPVVWDMVFAHMAGVPTYGPATVVAGLYRATAGATLILSPGGRIDVEAPAAIAFDGPGEVAPGADPEGILIETVTGLLAARPLERARTAVELSGGMDSALAALATAAVAGPGLMSVGAQFGGAMGEAQRQRRELLRAAGGFDDLSVPAERLAPFSPSSRRRVRYGVWPEDENYPEIFEAIFAMLQAAGIDSLISGFGGDELYFAYEGEEEPAGEAGTRCPFLSPAGIAAASRARRTYPRTWLQESCWQSAAGQSQRLLRYGLWPVYPYLSEPLARFVSRLPRCWRRDRRLLRRTLGRLLGSPVFETAYVKESFDPVARRGLTENRDYLVSLVGRSPLSGHPDVDDRAIVAALSGDIGALERDTYNVLFRTLKLFCFFQSTDPDGGDEGRDGRDPSGAGHQA